MTNTSAVRWPEEAILNIGNHWLNSDGSVYALDDGRAKIGALEPGASSTRHLRVTAPGEPGRYSLALDLVEEGVRWFDASSAGIYSSPVDVKQREPQANTEVVSEESKPEPFTMNAIPRERVYALVEEAGGVVAADRPINSTGPEWETYRYYARRV